MDITQALEFGLAAGVAALLGSMLGLGGGVFLVPFLTLFFGVDPKIAIGASAVAVVTNSLVGAPVHLRNEFTNLRMAMLLLVPTALAALVGALIAVWAPDRLLNAIFGAVLVYAAVSMLMKRQQVIPPPAPDAPDPWSLRASYPDAAAGTIVTYQPVQLPAGLGIGAVAGLLAGMLGVGGGVIQVPTMNLLMKVPVKAAAGTSTFMVGVTAVATGFVAYAHDKIDPTVVVPCLLGVYLGAQVGSRLTRRVKTQRLVSLFVLILLGLGASLLWKAAGLDNPFGGGNS